MTDEQVLLLRRLVIFMDDSAQYLDSQADALETWGQDSDARKARKTAHELWDFQAELNATFPEIEG